MPMKWMTLHEIALDRHMTLEEAQRFVDRKHCPRVFGATTTHFLI